MASCLRMKGEDIVSCSQASKGVDCGGIVFQSNRSWFALITFCATTALVAALGLAILIASATVAFAVAQSLTSQRKRASVPSEQVFAGVITDARCGARHSTKFGQGPADCSRACVRDGSHYTLVNGDEQYALEGNGTEVEKLAGQRALISGVRAGETIQITAVTPQ
jgi:hypothetical protein